MLSAISSSSSSGSEALTETLTEGRGGVGNIIMIGEVEELAARVQVAIDAASTRLSTSSSSGISGGVTVESIRAQHAAAAASHRHELILLLAAVEKKSSTRHKSSLLFQRKQVSEHKRRKVLLLLGRRLDARIASVHDSIESIKKKNLCTADSCKLWADFRTALIQGSDEIHAYVFDKAVLSSRKANIYSNLTKMAGDILSSTHARLVKQVVEGAIMQLDRIDAVSDAADSDLSDALQNLLIKSLDHLLNTDYFDHQVCENDQFVAQQQYQEANTTAAIIAMSYNKSSLAANVSALLASDDIKSLFTVATSDSLQEEDVYILCIALASKLLREETKHSEEEFVAHISSSSLLQVGAGDVTEQNTRRTPSSPSSEMKKLVDFALAPRGGRVVPPAAAFSSRASSSALTAPPYVPTLLNSVGLLGGYSSASVVISSSLPPALGDCYAFPGTSGNITILLAAPTVLHRIGLYQKHQQVGKHGVEIEASAARAFSVFGWRSLPTHHHHHNHHVLGGHKHQQQQTWVRLGGSFSMDAQQHGTQQRSSSSGSSAGSEGYFQLFSLKGGEGGGKQEQEEDSSGRGAVQAVTVQFEDNFGSDEFTCVYRVQLLGEPAAAADEK
jgi:hypothetical protein